MTDKNKTKITLADAYNVVTPDDSRDLYGRWASTYDKTFVEDNKYIYPQMVARVLAKHMPEDRAFTVIDVGCGTGALGEAIVNIRPKSEIEGVDISPEMLEVAKTKLRADGSQVYSELHEADLTETIYFAANYFDYLVSAGAFTIGHLGAYELIDILCVCRSGATIVVGVNGQHWENDDFASAITEAVNNKTITKPQYEEVEIYGEGSEHHGDKGRVVIFKKI